MHERHRNSVEHGSEALWRHEDTSLHTSEHPALDERLRRCGPLHALVRGGVDGERGGGVRAEDGDLDERQRGDEEHGSEFSRRVGVEQRGIRWEKTG